MSMMGCKRAMNCGEIEAMQYLREKGRAIISCVDINKKTPLLLSSEHGYLSAVQWLLQEGANIYDFDDCNKTVLLHAASAGHLALVKWLVESTNVDLAARDVDTRTAMLTAAFGGHIATVEWLLANGSARIDETERFYNETALIISASRGRFEMVKWLLEKGGAQISESDSYGTTVLETAVGYNSSVIRFENVGRIIDHTDYVGNEAMILWLLRGAYVNANNVWLAIGKSDDILTLHQVRSEQVKPSLLLVSLLLMTDAPTCFTQTYHGEHKVLIDVARERAVAIRAMNPAEAQKEAILKAFHIVNLALIVATYAHPSAHEIWYELGIDSANKKRRRTKTSSAIGLPPRRNPERAARSR